MKHFTPFHACFVFIKVPNREYYAVYDGMNQDQLIQTLNNKMFYCLLQLILLLILIFTLKRIVGHSPIRQISFSLENQFDYLQLVLESLSLSIPMLRLKAALMVSWSCCC